MGMHWEEIGPHVVHNWACGGKVEVIRVLVAHPVDELHQRSQCIAVGHDHDVLPLGECGRDAVIPEGLDTGGRVFEALGKRHLPTRVPITLVSEDHPLQRVVLRELGRRAVVRAPPRHDLVDAVDLRELTLVIPREHPAVLLVQPHVLHQWHPALIRRGEHQASGAYSSSQQGCADEVVLQAFLRDEGACRSCLGDPSLREIYVDPSSESVCQVPLRLPVAHDRQLRMHLLCACRSATSLWASWHARRPAQLWA
jgi:hypothetical protein